MRFSENYIAVGVTNNQEEDTLAAGVVIVVAGLGKFTINEHGARKLADDIIRNANYLWPEKEDSHE